VSLIEVLLGVTHFEEVVVLPASERIVSVGSLEARALKWFLDVPEGMVRNGSEHLLLH
jgi:hypothetical protein